MKKCILFITIALYTTIYGYAQEHLKIDTTKSDIKWFGDYTFYFGGHYGNIQLKEGSLVKANGLITGGSFVIDMDTITSTDIENEEANAGLVNHLKNEDFFDVKNYPLATLIITSTRYHDDTNLEIRANLTIKGITIPIKFQAEVDYGKLHMLTKFKIDRTLWGINYNSTVKDNAISEAIGFEVKLSL